MERLVTPMVRVSLTLEEAKVEAFNLLLTAPSPTVRALAERYLQGVYDMDEFLKVLARTETNDRT